MSANRWPTSPAGTEEDFQEILTLLNEGREIDPTEDAEFYAAQREEIEGIARELLDSLEENEEAYRLRNALNDLEKIEYVAGTLYRSLLSLNLIVIGHLSGEIHIGSAPTSHELNMNRSAQELLVYDDTPGPHPLALLSAAAGRLRGRMINDYGTGDPNRPDPGGKKTLSDAIHGNHRRQFVAACAMMLVQYLGSVSGSDGGTRRAKMEKTPGY